MLVCHGVRRKNEQISRKSINLILSEIYRKQQIIMRPVTGGAGGSDRRDSVQRGWQTPELHAARGRNDGEQRDGEGGGME